MSVDRRALEAKGYLVVPGFIDLHAHLREPGFEDSETIATGAKAALRGGFTTVCAMPNTEPAIDSPGLVAELIARGGRAGGARVLPIASITRGRKGRELSDLVELAAAGAVAFSDDGSPVDDARLFRSALEYARVTGRPVIEHAQDLALSAKGVMHEGAVSARLGLPGMPAAAEETAVARDIALAKMTGGLLHLTHLSTAGSIELVRRAKADGVPITCDVTPHHLAMTDDWVAGSRAFAWEVPDEALQGVPYDSSTKVNPPLRGQADVRSLWAGIADATVDAIATDHAPHASVKKEVEFDQAAFGISGLETALALVLGGVRVHWAPMGAVIDALTIGPARVLGIQLQGDDWIAIDVDAEWLVTADELQSKGKNTPILGRTLIGRAVHVSMAGETKLGGRRVENAEAVGRR
ncbi:MAG TPA: dihydroorotase [Methylomirabilota bacterium]|nr:dihydroorotase [Methylomirabilota bacterium]